MRLFITVSCLWWLELAGLKAGFKRDHPGAGLCLMACPPCVIDNMHALGGGGLASEEAEAGARSLW